MSQENQQEHISKKMVVYQMPGIECVTVRRDVEYRASDAGALTMDLYYPPNAKSEARIPAVIIVAGYPDLGIQKIFGCKFKEMGSSISWGQLAAASGLVAITYTNREPMADLHPFLQHDQQNPASLRSDKNRTYVCVQYGNVRHAVIGRMQIDQGIY